MLCLIFLGKPISKVYHYWRLGEPNNHGGEEDCVELYRSGYLNDKSCDKKFRFICKKSLQTLQWNHDCNMPDSGRLFRQLTFPKMAIIVSYDLKCNHVFVTIWRSFDYIVGLVVTALCQVTRCLYLLHLFCLPWTQIWVVFCALSN